MRDHRCAYGQLHCDLMASLRTEHPDWSEDVFGVYERRLAALLHKVGSRVVVPPTPMHLKTVSQIF